MRKRILIFLAMAAAFIFGWLKLEKFSIQVVGQPSVTGVVQKKIEEPFFLNLAKNTGLPLEVSYIPNDELGIKDTFQLLLLKSGALELVSLRFLQNAVVEPMLLGIDLSGATSDIRTARAVADAYAPILNRTLESDYRTKLLGVWPFGPQVFFCRRPIKGLKDIADLKIRVGSENFGPLIASFGGKPVVIPFEDVKSSLRSGIVDCAITSATSGNAAGWPEYSTHFFSLGTQFGVNGYVISLNVWNRLSQGQQKKLLEAVQQQTDAIWLHIEKIHQDMSSCNVGGPCKEGVRYQLINVVPSEEDLLLLQHAFENTTFRDWAQKCDRLHPDCSREWRAQIAPLLNRYAQ